MTDPAPDFSTLARRSEGNAWEKAMRVWSRFTALYPDSRIGAWRDPEEGPVYIERHGTVVRVAAAQWEGQFHLRDKPPGQMALSLGDEA